MKKLLICIILIFNFLLVGYDYLVPVYVQVDELPINKLEVSYNAKAYINENLNKSDFTVIPYYEWDNGKEILIYKGNPISFEEINISPLKPTKKEETIKVSYKNYSQDITIICEDKGSLIITTDGLESEFSVEAIKQANDDSILNQGKDIVYTIKQKEKPKKEPISKEIQTAIDIQKNIYKEINILASYDISVEREVVGEEKSNLEKLHENIYITLTIPTEYRKENVNYWMAHQHKNTIEFLKDLDDNENTITIMTSSFSNYVLYTTLKESVIKPQINIENKNENTNYDTKHNHDFTILKYNATCISPEYTVKICSYCAHCIQSETANALGHDWVNKNNALICSRCNIKQIKEIPSIVSPTIKDTNISNKKPVINLPENTIIAPKNNKKIPAIYSLKANDSLIIDENENIIMPTDEKKSGISKNLMLIILLIFVSLSAAIYFASRKEEK